jgi:uncharacterized protein
MSDEHEFEWDPAKADANVRKHALSFASARLVFADPFAVVEYDEINSDAEDRFRATGLVADSLISVFYTERGSTIRIISARRANNHERREYHEGKGSS